MKKNLAAVVLIAVVVCLIGSAVAADAAVKWKWAHYQPVGSMLDKLSKSMIQEIEEKSGGAISIKLYPAGQLGDWMEVSEQIIRGSVDIGILPVSPSFDPRIQVRVLPYSVMNWEEAKAAYTGESPYILEILTGVMKDIGLKALGVVAEGFGGGGFASIPDFDMLDPAADKKGFKMRFTPGNQAWERLVVEMGFIPTPVPWGELYLAQQTKLVDCQIGGQPYNTWTSFRDVTKVWVQYNTHFQNSFVYMNLKEWEKLTPELQKIVQEACAKYAAESFSLAEGADADYMEKMKQEGIKIVMPTNEQLQKIATLARTKVWPVMDDVIGKEIMDLMREKSGVK